LILGPGIMIVYLIGILYLTTLVLQLTALIAAFGVLGLLTWIGYMMLTEPPSPQVRDTSELDELEPENIPGTFTEPKFSQIIDVDIGQGTIVRDHVNLYKCRIGKYCKIESFVYIEEGVRIGDNCKIKPHVFIPTGVTIEDEVFLGPNVTFTNDKYPRAAGEWKLISTVVEKGASIGANSVILPGVRIGKNASVGAGSVVTKDVPDGITVCGNPAKSLVK